MKKNKNNAFTLVELTISLTIIGVIFSAILIGKDLIQNAQFKRIYKDLVQYKKAILTFQQMYGSLPGDFQNASTTLLNISQGAVITNPYCIDGIVPTGCNGDGNNRIEAIGGTQVNNSEMLRAWQHMSLAQLIPNDFIGDKPSTSQPKGPLDNSFYAVRTMTVFGKTATYIEFGGLDSTGFVSLPVITPQNAYIIDSKYDDGIANTGEFLAVDGSTVASGSCSKPMSDPIGANYNFLNNNIVCKIVFLVK